MSRVAAHHQAQLEGTPVAADAQFAKQDSEDDEEVCCHCWAPHYPLFHFDLSPPECQSAEFLETLPRHYQNV